MPYIEKSKRQALELSSPCNAGELNYEISSMCGRYLLKHGLSYNKINEVIGVLECSKLELYRRLAGPYEDKKRAVNGDIESYHKISHL